MMETLPYVGAVVHVGGHADEQSLSMTSRPVSCVFFTLVAACANHADPATTRSTTTVESNASPAPNPMTARAAEATLRAWLDASREGSSTAASLDTLSACDDGDSSYFPTTILADFVILPSEFRGDTVVGRADVVTVAEQGIDRRSNGFVAHQRIRHDVLEWDVIPVDETHWVVCNGLRFGYRGADSLTTWQPNGSSYRSARALVDSIAMARHL